MLQRVTATRFYRRMTVGKTWPCLLACTRPTGEEVDIIAKYSAGCENKVASLSTEAIVAMLAADLELPIPEPFTVTFDPDFIDDVAKVEPTVAGRIRQSAPIAFGLAKLPPGFIAMLPDMTDAAVRAQAAEIFAFDMIIDNADRRVDNLNCLHDGRNFGIFDHELSFYHVLGWRPPWEVGALERLKTQHAFYGRLSGYRYDLSRLGSAWKKISDPRLREYTQTLPQEWVPDHSHRQRLEDIVQYLSDVRENIDAVMAETVRALA